MKRFRTIVLLLALMLGMTACHIRLVDTPPTTEPATAPTEPTTVPAPDTELTVGETLGKLYHNPYFGLVFTLPDGWRYATDEQLCEENGVSMSDVELKPYLGDGSEFLTVMKASHETGRVAVSLAKCSKAIKGMGIENYMPIAKDSQRVIFEKADNGIELLHCDIVDVTLSGTPTKALLYELNFTENGISNYYVEAYLLAGDYMLTIISSAVSAEAAMHYLTYFSYPTI